jgi:D-beta-D-heptose 7-phosphate kinase/D-beta-D-heptose 1-phosphate adenosyltransferase
MGRPKIIVVGDLMVDRYVFGSMARISPEAPIGILRVTDEEWRLGGAGAVARNLAVLGAQVRLFGFLGTSGRGKTFARLAEEAGVDGSGIVRVYGRETTLKSRLIARRGAGGQQVLRVDHEDPSPYPESEEAQLVAGFLGAIDDAELVVLSDYAKGALSAALTARVVAECRGRGVPVLIDPKPPAYRRYRGATALTPNRAEASTYAGFRVDGEEAAARAALKIREELELDAVVIKLDEDGLFLATSEGESSLFPIVPREVYDVTGAGDMVISTIAMVLASGGQYPDAVRIANVAAGIEVGHLGVVPVSREEILMALVSGSPGTRGKVLSRSELQEVLAARRQHGESVVFTNGCYDLLHAGHIRLLRAARREGDLLVVGLNSDASVRRLKGESRPINPEAERAEVLASLSCVDYVVVFDEDTPLELVSQVLPDVLVKGQDWAEKGVVGREIVEQHGGTVVLVPLTPGLSSTSMIEKLKGGKD